MQRRFLTIGAIGLSLLFSGFSLAIQLKESQTSSPFDPYLRPVPWSDLERRLMAAEIEAIRLSMPCEDGVCVPTDFMLSKDKQKIIIWVSVAASSLPTDFELRKRKLRRAAFLATAAMGLQFLEWDIKMQMSRMSVRFREIACKDTLEKCTIATFENDQLNLR